MLHTILGGGEKSKRHENNVIIIVKLVIETNKQNKKNTHTIRKFPMVGPIRFRLHDRESVGLNDQVKHQLTLILSFHRYGHMIYGTFDCVFTTD